MKCGVDLGGTKVQAVFVSDRFAVKGEARRPTPTDGGPPAVAAEVAAAVRDAAKAAGIEVSALTGVGVGSAGAVDAEAGTVAEAGNLPDWQEPFALGPALEKALGVPIILANDVEVAVDAEFRLGAGKPYSSLLGVFWGSGIGGGMILDSKSWRGRGAAGEIGHMVIKRNGARCACGRRGCVEAYSGRTAMERRARQLVKRGARTELFEIMEERGRERLTSAVWAHALEKGDRLAVQLIDRAVAALGAGVASALNLLDVEAVVIGGGLGVRLGEPYLERIGTAMMPHLFVRDRPPAMTLAALGDLGGAIGAALLAPAGRRARPVAKAATADGAGG
jgi:glucokinase